MARWDDRKIVDRLDQYHRADARRVWESVVKTPDTGSITAAAPESVEAITERFDALERSILWLKRENSMQVSEIIRSRRQARMHLIVAAIVAAVVGSGVSRIAEWLRPMMAVMTGDHR